MKIEEKIKKDSKNNNSVFKTEGTTERVDFKFVEEKKREHGN